MKVLYIASNPDGLDSLALEKEVSELQRRFLFASGDPVRFTFLPNVTVEDLASEISRAKPDILHISAHGARNTLTLANAAGAQVHLTGALLATLMDNETPPRLVYLNACDSDSIAREIAKTIPVAIGTTAPITNRTARAAAVLFYERLLEGINLQKAFEASAAVMHALSERTATSKLYPRDDVRPVNLVFHQVPKILARFSQAMGIRKRRDYAFDVGLMGCPQSTFQVVFFTTDESFADYEDEDIALEEELCTLIIDRPVNGELWCYEGEWSGIEGDFPLYACGVTADGRQFVTSSTLCEALTLYYSLEAARSHTNSSSAAPQVLRVPEHAKRRIKQLRQNDGSIIAGLGDVVVERKSRRNGSSVRRTS